MRDDRRPNVLLIYGEDLGPQLGCYGESLIETPHIDRLAREGMRFRRAFVTCPVCSPSRSAMIAGRYQTSFGAHHHRSGRDRPLPESVRLVTDCFRDAGYFTCNSPGPPYDRPGKTDFNFHVDQPFDGVDWSERAPGQPFYAQCNIGDTHRMQRFNHGPAEAPPNPDDVVLPPYYPDHPLARRDWALYLDSVQRLDRKVGQVLDRLDEEGLTDRTIVMLLSDHGPGHPRHKQFCYDGGLHIPLIVRWPGHIEAGAVRDELVSAIDIAPTCLALAGAPVDENMEGRVFLGPDRDRPRDHIVAARDRCDGTLDRIRAVRTERFKYIRNFEPHRPWLAFNGYKEAFYPLLPLMRVLHERGELSGEAARFLAPTRPPEELYDLSNDPHELHNLAEDPAHEPMLIELRQTLSDWIDATGDEGQCPEDPATQQSAYEQMMDTFAQWMRERGLSADCDDRTHLQWWNQWIAERGGWAPLAQCSSGSDDADLV